MVRVQDEVMHTYMTPDAFFKPVYTEILVGFDAHDYLGRRRLEKEDIWRLFYFCIFQKKKFTEIYFWF